MQSALRYVSPPHSAGGALPTRSPPASSPAGLSHGGYDPATAAAGGYGISDEYDSYGVPQDYAAAADVLRALHFERLHRAEQRRREAAAARTTSLVRPWIDAGSAAGPAAGAGAGAGVTGSALGGQVGRGAAGIGSPLRPPPHSGHMHLPQSPFDARMGSQSLPQSESPGMAGDDVIAVDDVDDVDDDDDDDL